MSSEARNTITRIAIDAIDASGAVSARIAEAFVDVVFTIAARCSRLTTALIPSNQIFAMATELARIRFALIDLRLAQKTIVAWLALACERVDTIDAVAVMTRGTLTVVDVDFAVKAGESLWAIASVSGDRIPTDATILTWSADAVIDVDVAFLAGKTRRADAFVAIDHVSTYATIDARIGSAFVNVHFTMYASITCNSNVGVVIVVDIEVNFDKISE